MKGLWRVPTNTTDPGLGITVYDGLVAALVTFITLFTIIRTTKEWPEARLLLSGLVLLSLFVLPCCPAYLKLTMIKMVYPSLD